MLLSGGCCCWAFTEDGGGNGGDGLVSKDSVESFVLTYGTVAAFGDCGVR